MEISRVHHLMKEALDYRATREDLISSNIANVDTPGYRARDIDFEEILAEKRGRIFSENSRELRMARTNARHLPPAREEERSGGTLFFRDGHLARNDGNTVDLDVETTEMAKNTVMYNALVAALKKDSAIFRSVIDASSKI
ncbi:flagellar basal body rod protein FlgB [Hydrogenimonas sp.]